MSEEIKKVKKEKKSPNTVRIVDEELMDWVREHNRKTGVAIYRIIQDALRAFRAIKG